MGNNTPVFFVRDPLKFPDFIHTQKRDPKTNLRNNAAAWDFWSLSPESLHQVTILMSDRGLPRNFRQMNGFGSHTYSFINAKGERYWVKFHFTTMQGHAFYTDQEAAEVVGHDRESAQRDLFENIEHGDYPRWRFCVQVMPEDEAETYRWNPFDLTKVWPHADYPLIEVGILELNRNPENYFAEVEQAAFSPANIVPGIGHSPDKMLQARIFSYADAHRYRLGVFRLMHPKQRERLFGNIGSKPSQPRPATVNWSPPKCRVRTDVEEGGRQILALTEQEFARPSLERFLQMLRWRWAGAKAQV